MAREVRDALVRGGPVVALETTYVSHGFPHPTGVETAIASEASVRAAGAVPATIALMDGEIRVGLGPEDLERIALEHPRKVVAARPRGHARRRRAGGHHRRRHRRDRAACGIHHAATGGIGGVHRDAERTFDISADLDRAGARPGVPRLLRCEVDPRRPAHARGARDARHPRRRVRHVDAAAVLLPGVGARRAGARRHRRPGGGAVPHPLGARRHRRRDRQPAAGRVGAVARGTPTRSSTPASPRPPRRASPARP